MTGSRNDIIALSLVPGIGPRRIKALFEKAGSAEEIFRMPLPVLSGILRLSPEAVSGIRSVRNSEEYAEELAYIEREGIRPVCYEDEDYPAQLRDIYDPPAVLYCRGKMLPEDANAVAIVGARKCSLYGIQMAEKLGSDLAERGITVISGMARGIDSAAHRGALKAGGRTIAVMGSGFRHIYPAGSEKFMRAISESGSVITEYPSQTMPSRSTFPRRNRIISGMSKGVVVVEAARKSGAMITVDLALEQGKEVFAVPGRADFHVSGGTNALIQGGAKLVMGVDDILEELGMIVQEPRAKDEHDTKTEHDIKTERELGEEERGIIGILQERENAHIDILSGASGIDLARLPEILLKLEMKGLIKALPGGSYIIGRKKAHAY